MVDSQPEPYEPPQIGAREAIVGTRLLIMMFFVSLLFLLGLAGVAALKLFMPATIPGWSVLAAALLVVLAGQALIAAFALVFSITMNRSQLGFLPIRDYLHFIRREVRIFER